MPNIQPENLMRFLAPFLLLLAGACSPNGEAPETAAMVSPILTTQDAKDPFTFAQPEIARVTHVALNLALDFGAQSVAGSATLDIQAAEGADTVILDSSGLDISGITDAGGAPLAFTVGDAVEGKGAPVTVTMGDARQITVVYSAKNAAALQWLTPAQTAGGKHPYLLSQGQPTLNRTWIPTQDSPGIRQTWEARIVVPEPLTVVMSGLIMGDPEAAGEGKRAFTFTMRAWIQRW